MTDTDRLDWLERVGGSLTAIHEDGALLPSGWAAKTRDDPWVSGDSPRAAIDRAHAQHRWGQHSTNAAPPRHENPHDQA